MSVGTIKKRAGQFLALLLLVAAATATVIGLLNADSAGRSIFLLGFLSLFVAGLVDLVGVLRRA